MRSTVRVRPACLAASLWLLGAGAVGAQTLPAPQNVLQFATEASAELLQDTLSITLQAVRDGSDAAAVQSQLRQLLDAALAEGRKSVRPGQLELRTGAFSVGPRYAAKPQAGNAIVGWQGRAELVLEGRDSAAVSQLAGRLGAVSAGAPGAGAAGLTVARVGYSLSREAREGAEAEVSARAVARFRQRAEDLARQFGFGSYSLREVNIGVAEVAAPNPQGGPRLLRAMAAPGADESQPVEAGRATLSVTVSGSVQLSPR